MDIPGVRAQGPVRRQEAPEGGWPPGGPYLRSPGVSSCSALWLKGEPLPAHLLLTPHPRLVMRAPWRESLWVPDPPPLTTVELGTGA